MLRKRLAVLTGIVLVLSIASPAFSLAASNVKANYLKVAAPAVVRAGKEFAVSVTGKEDGEPAEGASVYLSCRYEPLALDTGSGAEPAERTLLGVTGEEGDLMVTLQSAGNYFLVAEMSGYSQGMSAVTVRKVSSEISFTVDKQVYLQGEEVVMTLSNGLGTSVTLPGGAPWTIAKPNKETVYTPVSTMALVEVKTGESQTWTWDQKDTSGAQAKPGAYLVTLSTSSGSVEAKFSVSGLRTQKAERNTDPVMPADRPFADVTGVESWGDPHVLALYQKGIVGGKGNGRFDPEGTLTRAEFVTMVLRACGLEPGSAEGEDHFADTTQAHWAWANVSRAVQTGIVRLDEYPEGFGPDVPITRLEICVMATRALGLEGEAGQLAGEALGFGDGEEVHIRYRGYVMSAVDWGILKGYEDNTFRPGKNATRREAAVIVYRLMNQE